MKWFSILTLVLLSTLIISACGGNPAEATPTISAADFQSTIAAGAITVIAETQAAIPAATQPPPTATVTNTPSPTVTLAALPSSAVTSTAAASGNSGGDPCIYTVLPATLQGEPIRMRIDNSTRAEVSVSVNLQQSGPQSVCGYRSYTLAPGEYIVINDLVEGCYTLWAWDPNPDTYFIVTNGTSCIDSSDNAVFDISTSSIRLGQ
ncbi:MAG TPA: hypothetical protein VJ785_11400 [Anaerolineales bacterium]|nr:hypothetical protein [Anaerolineales bacterium]